MWWAQGPTDARERPAPPGPRGCLHPLHLHACTSAQTLPWTCRQPVCPPQAPPGAPTHPDTAPETPGMTVSHPEAGTTLRLW